MEHNFSQITDLFQVGRLSVITEMNTKSKFTMNGILHDRFLKNLRYFSGFKSILNWLNRQPVLDRAVRENSPIEIENELMRVLKESKKTSEPGFRVDGEDHICVLLYLLYYRMEAPMNDDFYNDEIHPVMKWEDGYYNSLNMLNYVIRKRNKNESM